MNKAFWAVLGTGLVGVIVFLLVQFSDVSVGKDGVSIGVGSPTADARCQEAGPDCLPSVEMADVSGKVWSPELLAGKVVVVNFWATWCGPCISEIPELAKVQRKYASKGLVILGLVTDNVGDSRLSAFRTRHGLDYPVVRAGRTLSQAFGHPRSLPTNFVYGRDGRLVFHAPGAISAGALERQIRDLL